MCGDAGYDLRQTVAQDQVILAVWSASPQRVSGLSVGPTRISQIVFQNLSQVSGSFEAQHWITHAMYFLLLCSSGTLGLCSVSVNLEGRSTTWVRRSAICSTGVRD
jgi:hypothetical protein